MSTHKDRVVLAYSGGLDTSVAIGWVGGGPRPGGGGRRPRGARGRGGTSR